MSDTIAPERPNRDNTNQAIESSQALIPQKYLILGIVGLVLLVAIIVALVIVGVGHPAHTQTFRDIAIIALAFQSGLIGLALIVLIIQVARLVNMLEYEIKPILNNTVETVNTVRGTAFFMSDHVVSPMIKASGYASGLARLFGSFRNMTAGGGSASSRNDKKDVESSTKEGEKDER